MRSPNSPCAKVCHKFIGIFEKKKCLGIFRHYLVVTPVYVRSKCSVLHPVCALWKRHAPRPLS